MIAYLAGSMHGLKGYGKRWRDREKKWLNSYGVDVFSPPDREPEVLKKHGVEQYGLNMDSHKIDAATRVPLFQEIIQFDLFQVRRRCDVVLVHLSKESAGTCSEITHAWLWKKPVHLVNATGCKLNPWVEACCTTIHDNWQQLRNHIRYKYNLRKKK